MAGVNRYLEDKAMDHIDHALGRPVDAFEETYRNYFYVCGETELRRQMEQSPHWSCCRVHPNGAYFEVTQEGRRALAAHLKQIGDKHRRFIVSWGGYDMSVVAETASKARYQKWLEISDTDDSLTFAKFQRTSRVAAA